MTDVPDGWRLWPDGLPYPDDVELDSYGEPYEAAGFYALRQALEAGGCADPNIDAWNGLAHLRGLGFDVVWTAVPGYTPRPLDPNDQRSSLLDSREARQQLLALLFKAWDLWDKQESRAAAANAFAWLGELLERYRWQLRVEGILEPEDDHA